MANVLGSRPLNVSFRRALVGENMRLWMELVSKMMNTSLTDSNDTLNVVGPKT